MKARLREKILVLISLFVVVLWLSPNWINFSFSIGLHSYNWTTFVLFYFIAPRRSWLPCASIL